jgi:hypothetical protein
VSSDAPVKKPLGKKVNDQFRQGRCTNDDYYSPKAMMSRPKPHCHELARQYALLSVSAEWAIARVCGQPLSIKIRLSHAASLSATFFDARQRTR